MARMRSRSPRRGDAGNGPGPSAIPLADFLLQRGILDERSVDYLKKAPIEFASEVLLSLGPEDRPALRYDDRPPLGRPNAIGGWACTVHCNGEPQDLAWGSQEQVVAQLVDWGMLDEGSADFLMKAPEQAAKEIVASLGPDVRNPSAFVTRKLKWLQQQGGGGYADNHGEPAHGGTMQIHFNGATMPLQWFSQEQALADLVSWGVLDEGSADFLSKAPEHEARGIVASLGPDVRNPSAFVTRKVKALLHGGGGRRDHVEPAPSLSIFCNGAEIVLNWPSRDEALGQLVAQGILDDRSADFLAKVPEQAAFEIVGRLGPDVRNPSAFVTKEAKKWMT